MKRHQDDPKHRELPPTGQTNAIEAAKFELPIDLDDIVAAAIFDVLRVRRRRFRNRGAKRHK